MERSSSVPYLFGDLLALARRSWVRQMAERLERAGYPGYRGSDAAVMRLLRVRRLALGELAAAFSVSRQAARKLADSLAARGLASLARDPADARRVVVSLTPAGERYARAIVEAVHALNRDLAGRVPPGQLAAADEVLRACLVDDRSRARAELLVPPPGAWAGGPGR